MNNADKEPKECVTKEERVSLAQDFFLTRHGWEPGFIKELVKRMQDGEEWIAVYVTPTAAPYLGQTTTNITIIVSNPGGFLTLHTYPDLTPLNNDFAFLVKSGRYPNAKCYYLSLEDFIMEYTNVYRELQGDVGSNSEARSNSETEV